MATKNENNYAEIDFSNENQFIKDLKQKVTEDMNNMAVTNMNNERNLIDMIKRCKTKTTTDITAYYEEQALKGEDGFNNYYIERDLKKNKTKTTSILSLKSELRGMNTDLTKIPDSEDFDEEVYNMLLTIISSEKIARTMLETINNSDNYKTFKKNLSNKAFEECAHPKGHMPNNYTTIAEYITGQITEYIENLTLIMNLAITNYNKLNIAYTEITNSQETPDYLNKKMIEKSLEPTF